MVVELLIALLAIIAYLPSRNGPFIFDDIALGLNPNIMGGKPVLAARKAQFRHLTLWTFALQVKYLGQSAFYFHAGTMVLHAVNALLVAHIFGTVAGFFFAVHPLATHAVAYISGRSAVLAMTFALLAFAVIQSGYAPLALPLLIAACFAKEDAAMLFPVAALAGSTWNIPLWYLPLAAGVMVPLRMKQIRKLIVNNGDQGMREAGFRGVLKTPLYQLTAIIEHLERAPFWFVGLRYCVDPEYRPITIRRILQASVLVAAVLLLVRVNPLALALMVVPILPYLLVPMPDPILEQRLYFMTLGFALLFAQIPYAWVVIPLLAYRTWIRAHDWTSQYAFWKGSIRDGGRLDRAETNIASTAMAESMAKANDIAYMQQPVRPGVVRNPLALSRAQQEYGALLQKCEAHCRVALERDPKLALTRANLSMALWRQGRKPEGLAEARRAVEESPTFWQGWEWLGRILEEEKDLAGAEDAYRHATAVQVYATSSWNRLGLVYIRMGRYEEAAVAIEKARTVCRPDDQYLHNHATLLLGMGKGPEAEALFRQLPSEYLLTPEMFVAVTQEVKS